MSIKNITLLIILSAIWGSSFLFLKILVPVFGPFYSAGFRVLFGGLFLLLVFTIKKEKLSIKENLKTISLVALFQSALPFTLFSIAAVFIPSVLSVIINSLTPLFVALFAYILYQEKISVLKFIGLILGFSGIVLVTFTTSFDIALNELLIGVVLCTIGAASYGLAAIIVKKKCANISVGSVAVGSQLLSALVLMPIAFINGNVNAFSLNDVLTLMVFGIFCSGIALHIYFYLQTQIGPLKTTLVTLMQPIFGVIWGVLLLHESVGTNFVSGALMSLVGVAIVLYPQKTK